jgi:hypothetical protein
LIKTVVKLLVVGALLHAGVRAGVAASKYYRLRDAAWQVVVRSAEIPPDGVGDLIFERAVELDVPLERYDIDVRREEDLTTAAAFYTESVLLLPGFGYPVDLSFSVEARAIEVSTAKDFIP